MKSILRIALFPLLMILRLMLGIMAFLASIASSVLGLTVSLFAMLSMVEFVIGYWQNGIAFAVLALLASPVGLPGMANLTIDGLDHLLGFLEELLAAQS